MFGDISVNKRWYSTYEGYSISCSVEYQARSHVLSMNFFKVEFDVGKRRYIQLNSILEEFYDLNLPSWVNKESPQIHQLFCCCL